MPPPAIQTLAKDMSLNRGATRFKLGLRPCNYLNLHAKNIPAPPFQIYPVAPLPPTITSNIKNHSSSVKKGLKTV